MIQGSATSASPSKSARWEICLSQLGLPLSKYRRLGGFSCGIYFSQFWSWKFWVGWCRFEIEMDIEFWDYGETFFLAFRWSASRVWHLSSLCVFRGERPLFLFLCSESIVHLWPSLNLFPSRSPISNRVALRLGVQGIWIGEHNSIHSNLSIPSFGVYKLMLNFQEEFRLCSTC